MHAIILFAAAASAQNAQPAQSFPQQPPPVESMSQQELRDAVTRLRPYVVNGGVRPSRPAGCNSAQQRQFDFWIGEWDVSPTGSPTMVVGESTISRSAQGCVIEEYWRPYRGAEGHSLNGFDAADGHWHQYYLDATGRQTLYRGDLRDGVMYMDNVSGAGPGVVAGTRARMNFRALDANTVRQWGENLDAATNAWVVTWDLTYTRRPNSAPSP